MAETDSNFFLVNVSSTKTKAYAKIDKEDAAKILLHKWLYTRGKDPDGPQYARAKINGRSIKMHRYLMDAPSGYHVDHINGDTLDNRRSNLRICTAAQNQFNSRKHIRKSSEFKGVSWHKETKKWRSSIFLSKKQFHLGLFDDEIVAARAYDAAAISMFGEYAHLNMEAGRGGEMADSGDSKSPAARREGSNPSPGTMGDAWGLESGCKSETTGLKIRQINGLQSET